MTNSNGNSVVVIGGGVAGCAIARELAPDHRVAVIERSGIGSEASGLAAGLTAPTLFYHNKPAVARHANRFLRELHGTDGYVFTERPRIEIVPSDRGPKAKEFAASIADKEFPVSFLQPEEVAERYPMLELSSFSGAVEIRDAGFVDDPYVYTRALQRDADRRGAEFRSGLEVTGVIVEDGRVKGVRTANGKISASHVVCAAGWRTRSLLDSVVTLPVRPFALQCVTIDSKRPLDEGAPLGRLPSEAVYFRPQLNGRLRVGGGEYLVDDPGDSIRSVDENLETLGPEGPTAQEAATVAEADDEFRKHVADTVPRFLRGYRDADDVRILDGWKGFDGATPDSRPIIDAPAEAPNGLVVATGFNGLGITLSGIAASAGRSLVTGEPSPFPLEPFALNRFDSVALDFTLRDTFDLGTS